MQANFLFGERSLIAIRVAMKKDGEIQLLLQKKQWL